MALSAEDKKEVQELVAAGAAAAISGDAGKKAITELVTSAVGQATTTLTKTVETLAESVKKIGEAAPKGDDKSKGGSGGGKDNPKEIDAAEVVKAAVAEALKPIQERLAKEDAEKAKATEAAGRDALIKKTLTDKKYSGLLGHKTFVRDLHARGVKSEAEVEAALNEFIADQKALGVEIKPTAASPEAEGANKGGSGGAGGAAGKGLPLEERVKRMKEMSAQAGPVPVPVDRR